MQVEFIKLKRSFELHKEEYEEGTLRALRSGWYILGEELKKFENEFAAYLGVRNSIGVANGTDALVLAFRALDIGAGDEVIVPAGTYIASIMGITENGATPVFVDSDEYLLMDADAIEDKITERTKAILPVHLYGQACNMGKIMDIANRHGLYVVEDCAQCHGSSFEGRKTGTFGTIACFSFYPTKPLGAFGDAGALLTDNDALAEKLRMLRFYGSKVKYCNEIKGVNSRLDEIQAAILSIALKYLEDGNAERCKIAQKYMTGINNPLITLPKTRNSCSNVYHIFPVICEDRDSLKHYLADNGISTQIHYPIPPYVADCYREWGYKWEDFPNAAYIAHHEVSLPIYAGMPMDEVEYVIDVINGYCW